MYYNLQDLLDKTNCKGQKSQELTLQKLRRQRNDLFYCKIMIKCIFFKTL